MNSMLTIRRGSPFVERFCQAAILVSIWLLIVVTFTSPGRHGTQETGGVDLLALAKIAARGVSLALLSGVLLLRGPRQFKSILHAGLWPLALFTLWCIASAAWSSRQSLSLGQAGGLLVLSLLTITIALTTRDTKDLSRILFHSCLALLAVSCVLVASRYLAPNLGALTRADAGAGADGILHPTTAASTASLGVLLVLAAQWGWGWRWSRTLLIPALLIHGLVLYWSAARLALALTAVAVVALAATTIPRRRLYAAATVIAAVGVGVLILSPDLRLLEDASDSLLGYLRRGQTTSQVTSLSGRDELWPLMWESFLESPVRGHGYYVTTSDGEVRVWNDRGNISAHNVALQALTTGGLVGLGLLLWSLGRPMGDFLRTSHRAGHEARTLRSLLVAAWLWFFGWGLLNISFLAPYQPESAIFFVLLGLAVASSQQQRDTVASQADDSVVLPMVARTMP